MGELAKGQNIIAKTENYKNKKKFKLAIQFPTNPISLKDKWAHSAKLILSSPKLIPKLFSFRVEEKRNKFKVKMSTAALTQHKMEGMKKVSNIQYLLLLKYYLFI